MAQLEYKNPHYSKLTKARTRVRAPVCESVVDLQLNPVKNPQGVSLYDSQETDYHHRVLLFFSAFAIASFFFLYDIKR
jgi:hypothetical protein